jgi:hypothetical protein
MQATAIVTGETGGLAASLVAHLLADERREGT